MKARPKRANKVEVAVEEQPKEETRRAAKRRDPGKTDPKPPEPKKTGKGSGKRKTGNLSKGQRKR